MNIIQKEEISLIKTIEKTFENELVKNLMIEIKKQQIWLLLLEDMNMFYENLLTELMQIEFDD